MNKNLDLLYLIGVALYLYLPQELIFLTFFRHDAGGVGRQTAQKSSNFAQKT